MSVRVPGSRPYSPSTCGGRGRGRGGIEPPSPLLLTAESCGARGTHFLFTSQQGGIAWSDQPRRHSLLSGGKGPAAVGGEGPSAVRANGHVAAK